MKSFALKWIGVIAGLLIIGNVYAQDKPAGELPGKWIVCADTSFSEKYDCEKAFTAFEIFKDGTYTEYRKPAAPIPGTPPVADEFKGHWTLVKNVLTLDESDSPGKKTFPVVYNIAWLNNDRFYSNTSDGKAAPKLYVYFQRTN